MKQINVYFEDQEHKLLEKKKEETGLNWHDFLIRAIDNYEHKRT